MNKNQGKEKFLRKITKVSDVTTRSMTENHESGNLLNKLRETAPIQGIPNNMKAPTKITFMSTLMMAETACCMLENSIRGDKNCLHKPKATRIIDYNFQEENVKRSHMDVLDAHVITDNAVKNPELPPCISGDITLPSSQKIDHTEVPNKESYIDTSGCEKPNHKSDSYRKRIHCTTLPSDLKSSGDIVSHDNNNNNFDLMSHREIPNTTLSSNNNIENSHISMSDCTDNNFTNKHDSSSNTLNNNNLLSITNNNITSSIKMSEGNIGQSESIRDSITNNDYHLINNNITMNTDGNDDGNSSRVDFTSNNNNTNSTSNNNNTNVSDAIKVDTDITEHYKKTNNFDNKIHDKNVLLTDNTNVKTLNVIENKSNSNDKDDNVTIENNTNKSNMIDNKKDIEVTNDITNANDSIYNEQLISNKTKRLKHKNNIRKNVQSDYIYNTKDKTETITDSDIYNVHEHIDIYNSNDKHHISSDDNHNIYNINTHTDVIDKVPEYSLREEDKHNLSNTRMSCSPGIDTDSDESYDDAKDIIRKKKKHKKIKGSTIGNKQRSQWRNSNLANTRRTKKMQEASNISRVDIDTNNARDKGKVVMPSVTMLPKNSVNPKKPKDKKTKLLIEFEDLKPPDLKDKIIFNDKNIQKHFAKVAGLLITVLSKLDALIYNTTGQLNWDKINEIWELVLGIPQSILRKIKELEQKRNDDKDDSHNTSENSSNANNETNVILNEISLYNEEMNSVDIGIDPTKLRSVLNASERKYKLETENPVASKDMYITLNNDNTFSKPLASFIKESLVKQDKIIEERNDNTIRMNIGRILNIKQKDINRADDKVCRNNISSASNILGNAVTVTKSPDEDDNYDAEEAYIKLLMLHDSTQSLELPEVSSDINSDVRILESVKDMKFLIYSLNRRSAEDIYGWSAELLYIICKHKPIIVNLLLRIINAFIINGWYPESIFRCRMIAIPKRDKPGAYRPISIPCIYRKLISKVIMKLYSNEVKDELYKYQLGVGTPYSCEIIQTTITSAIDTAISLNSDISVIQLDLSNAYNKVNRANLIEQLMEYGFNTGMINYVRSMFMKEELVFYEGNIPETIPNTSGVAQGEIMSPLLFSFYLADCIKHIDSIYRTHISKLNESTSSNTIENHFLVQNKVPIIMSYLDDIFIIAPFKGMAEDITQHLIQDLIGIGMKVNYDKCKVFNITNGKLNMNDNMNMMIFNEPVVIQSADKLKALGAMITMNQQYRDEYFITKATETLRILIRSIHLHKQSFLLLTRMCISSKLIHIVKSTPISENILYDFDNILKAIVTHNMNINNEHDIVPLIDKPFSLGGLSIQTLSTIYKPMMSSLMWEMNKIEHIHKLNQITLSKNDRDNSDLIGFCSMLNKLSPILNTDMILNDADRKVKSHDIWLKEAKDEIMKINIELSIFNPEKSKVIEALGKDTNTAKWLQVVPHLPYQKINNDTMENSIKYRIGLKDEVYEYIRNMPIIIYTREYEEDKCPLCGYEYTPHHYSSCQCNGPMRTSRHNIIKKLLASALNANPNVSIRIEEKQEDVSGYIPDITVSILTKPDIKTDFETKYKISRNNNTPNILRFGIDLTITEINATNNIPLTKRGLYADAGEAKKLKHYKHYNDMNEMKILPFGISSVGGIGTIANDILTLIRETNTNNENIQDEIEKFKECSSILIESCRDKMRQIYIDTLNDRLKRIQKSKPMIKADIKDTMNIRTNELSKVNNKSNVSYWSKEINKQHKLEMINNDKTMITNKDNILNNDKLPWLNNDRKQELYNSNKKNKVMDIRESDSDISADLISNDSDNDQWDSYRRRYIRHQRYKALCKKLQFRMDTDYKDIDSESNKDIENNNNKKKAIIRDDIESDSEQKDKNIYNNVKNEKIYNNSDKDIYKENNIYKDTEKTIYNEKDKHIHNVHDTITSDTNITNDKDITSDTNITSNKHITSDTNITNEEDNNNIDDNIDILAHIYNNDNNNDNDNNNNNINETGQWNNDIRTQSRNEKHHNIITSKTKTRRKIKNKVYITRAQSRAQNIINKRNNDSDNNNKNNSNSDNNVENQNISQTSVGKTLNTTTSEKEMSSDLNTDINVKPTKTRTLKHYELRSRYLD